MDCMTGTIHFNHEQSAVCIILLYIRSLFNQDYLAGLRYLYKTKSLQFKMKLHW